jgi:CRP-like cAMP-binding protein
MPDVHDPNQNHLLAALLDAAFDRLAPHLEWVDMTPGDVLYQSGEKLPYVYFPTTSVISLHYVLENGDSSEVASVGNEGMLGISLFMGGNVTPSHALVQSGGHAYRLQAATLMQEWNRAGAVMRLLLRYTQALVTQISQILTCKRRHSVEQRLCRCLLLMLDRTPDDQLTVPQKLLAGMLGMQREGMTETIAKLQSGAVISYKRGTITVLDRAGLEAKVCGCYAVIKGESTRLLSALEA